MENAQGPQFTISLLLKPGQEREDEARELGTIARDLNVMNQPWPVVDFQLGEGQAIAITPAVYQPAFSRQDQHVFSFPSRAKGIKRRHAEIAVTRFELAQKSESLAVVLEGNQCDQVPTLVVSQGHKLMFFLGDGTPLRAFPVPFDIKRFVVIEQGSRTRCFAISKVGYRVWAFDIEKASELVSVNWTPKADEMPEMNVDGCFTNITALEDELMLSFDTGYVGATTFELVGLKIFPERQKPHRSLVNVPGRNEDNEFIIGTEVYTVEDDAICDPPGTAVLPGRFHPAQARALVVPDVFCGVVMCYESESVLRFFKSDDLDSSYAEMLVPGIVDCQVAAGQVYVLQDGGTVVKRLGALEKLLA